MTSVGRESSVDIYVVGLGIKAVQHVTREAEAAMRRCNRILYVDSGFGVGDFLTSLCPDTRSLLLLYKEGSDRRQTYQAMAAHVLNAAIDDAPVAFATYGNAQMYVHPTLLIRVGAARLGLTVRVLAGVSALDTIIADLALDPGVSGLQMYEATDAVARARPLEPDVPCLLWQISAIETAMYSTKRGNATRFARLQRYLLRIYPPDHLVTMVASSTFELLQPQLETFAVGQLAERLASGLQGGTLYIPPVGHRPVEDGTLVRDIYDPEHLARTSD